MANTSELKRKNMLNIIQLLRKEKIMTKPEIVEKTRLTAPTVHNFVNELVAAQMCYEVGEGASHGGRRAICYHFHDDFGRMIGISLERWGIAFYVYNLRLVQLYSQKVPCDLNNINASLDILFHGIEKAILETDRPCSHVLGIGVIIPGRISKESGKIITCPSFRCWEGMELKRIIQNRLGICVQIDNDNNSRALSASLSGIVGEGSALYLSIKEGVGAGLVADHKIFNGYHNYACEIGHVTIAYDGPVCRCGNRGCIEAMISDGVIIKKINAMGVPIQTIGQAVELYQKKDKAAVEVFHETTGYILIALLNIIKMYDPRTIIIESNWLGEIRALFDTIHEGIMQQCAFLRRTRPYLICNNDSRIIDASSVSLVLWELMTDYIHNPLLDLLDMQVSSVLQETIRRV